MPVGLNRHSLGPGEPALSEWAAAALALPDAGRLRRGRLERVRAQALQHDVAGVLLYDPLNLRYATDTTNMQVWLMHNASRYAWVPADGPVVLWEHEHCEHLSAHSDIVSEIRPCVPWFHFAAGQRVAEIAERWAGEIAELVHSRGGGKRRLAVDRCNPEGVAALRARGIEVVNGESLMEQARAIKGPEEIAAMRCAIHACERAMQQMREHLRPGISEQQLWAHLHAGVIARAGEWLETRLLSSGPRCNPWYQECSSRLVEDGDLVAFDTDLVGAYGYMCDMSRTWLAGDRPASAEQRDLYCLAHEQVRVNTERLRPGITFHELTHGALQHDERRFRRYNLLYHGVGMGDEAPSIYFPQHWSAYGHDGVLEPGMVLCVESYVGRIDGGPGVKLEDQVLITAQGHEVLTTFPYERGLLA